jgi:hypothetical protein
VNQDETQAVIREHDRLVAEYNDNGGNEVLESIALLECILFRTLDNKPSGAKARERE